MIFCPTKADEVFFCILVVSFLSLLAAFTTVGLLVGQMERSRTPSQLSKIALSTIIMQVILDGWLLVAHLMVGIVIDNHSSLSLIAPGFISGIGFLMFGPVRHLSTFYASASLLIADSYRTTSHSGSRWPSPRPKSPRTPVEQPSRPLHLLLPLQ